MSNLAADIFDNQGLEILRRTIDQEINVFLNTLPVEDALTNSLTYIISSGGKRIRPLITLSIISDLGGNVSDFSPCALAVELLHIASLVHDDLPALDNDDFRRGQATCHKKFDEATAVLSGDILIPLALSYIQRTPFNADQILKISRILCDAYRDVCLGQQMDLKSEKYDSDKAKIARLKTGALFAAAISMPFQIIPNSKGCIEIAAEAGKSLGVLYQICDDLADQVDSAGLKGRVESSDLRNQKDTFHTGDLESTKNIIQTTHVKVLSLVNELQMASAPKNNFLNFRECLNVLFAPFRNLQIKF